MWTGPKGASSRFLLAVLDWQGSLVRFLKKITFWGVILLVFWRLIIIMKEWFCAVWLEVPRALPSLWEKLRQRLSFLPLHQHWHHQAFNTISKISKFKIGLYLITIWLASVSGRPVWIISTFFSFIFLWIPLTPSQLSTKTCRLGLMKNHIICLWNIYSHVFWIENW